MGGHQRAGALGEAGHARSVQDAFPRLLRPGTAGYVEKERFDIEEAVAIGGIGLRILATEGICPLEGGLPLIQDGKIIGAIGVSGSQSTQDGQVALAGVAALNG